MRDEETWRWQLLSTGAVPTALHTVEDLLLQFFPLLLLLGQTLSRQLGRTLAAVQDFAVLGVPQVCVQAAWGAEECVVAASLCHFTLEEEKKKKKKSMESGKSKNKRRNKNGCDAAEGKMKGPQTYSPIVSISS